MSPPRLGPILAFLFICFISALSAGPLAAQNKVPLQENLGEAAKEYKRGADAYSRGDYLAALAEWQPLAEQGYTDAQNNLGYIFANGLGVKQDYAEASKWYRLSAQAGDASGQHNLGVIYAMGLGVPQDFAEALKWYRRSAEQGYVEAVRSLGVTYYHGRGVPKDNVESYKWFHIAAELGHPTAGQSRDLVARELTAAQRAKAQEMARAWLVARR